MNLSLLQTNGGGEQSGEVYVQVKHGGLRRLGLACRCGRVISLAVGWKDGSHHQPHHATTPAGPCNLLLQVQQKVAVRRSGFFSRCKQKTALTFSLIQDFSNSVRVSGWRVLARIPCVRQNPPRLFRHGASRSPTLLSDLIHNGRRMIRLVSFCLLVCQVVSATPFVPAHDNEILERLPRGVSFRQARVWNPLTPKVAVPSLESAIRLAKGFIQQGHAEADPRFLSYAQGALQPWWDAPNPEVRLLRAHIRQSNHDFTGALDDLDFVLRSEPANGTAWLIRATILQVRGEYGEARKCIWPLTRFLPELAAVTSAANLASLQGDAQRGYDLLESALLKNTDAPADLRVWACTVLGEIAHRLGKTVAAEKQFQRGLELAPADSYLLGAYADLLLDAGRPRETVSLLKEHTAIDSLLLRLALAEKAIDPNNSAFRKHVEVLRERFAAAKLRGDSIHQREEARFELQLLGQPLKALRLAQANWLVQREPADARILLEAAVAAHDSAAAQPAVNWLRRNRIEHLKLLELSDRLASIR